MDSWKLTNITSTVRRLGQSWMVWLLIQIVFCCLFQESHATCTKPALGANTYTLTQDKTSYAVNETYEIYCIPGYKISSNITLICTDSNEWSSLSPDCILAEGTYPWWMLLVAVTLVILVVACILPRMLSCCFGGKGKKKVSDEEDGEPEPRANYNYDDDGYDDERSDSPVPNFSKHKKMTNLEFMSKLHQDADRKTLKRAAKNAVF